MDMEHGHGHGHGTRHGHDMDMDMGMGMGMGMGMDMVSVQAEIDAGCRARALVPLRFHVAAAIAPSVTQGSRTPQLPFGQLPAKAGRDQLGWAAQVGIAN